MSNAHTANPSRSGQGSVDSWRASLTVLKHVTIGGRLTLTASELSFKPHRFNFGLGIGRALSLPLGDIRGVSVAPRGAHPWNGSLRRRLQVDTASESYFFVVSNVGNVAETIDRAVRGPTALG
jgi:hypothetical protein